MEIFSAVALALAPALAPCWEEMHLAMSVGAAGLGRHLPGHHPLQNSMSQEKRRKILHPIFLVAVEVEPP